MTVMTVAEALLRFLPEQYIELDEKQHRLVHGILGIFGHGNVGGIGSALARQSLLPFIQGFNEQGMVHTAVAFAKQKNRLGTLACTTSIGPGALNMVTGAATATINRLPVLLLPGDYFADRGPDPVLQQLECSFDPTLSVNDCFKPVSAFWDRITRPEQLMSSLVQAMRVLSDPVLTGAVVISLPQDVQAERFDYPEEFFRKRIYTLDRRPPSEQALKHAARLITSAKRPLLIAGGGVHYALAHSELVELVEAHAIPAAETQAGKGALPSRLSHNIGSIGVLGTSAANRLAAKADVIIAVGTRLSDFTTASKTVFKHPEHRIIHININRADACKLEALPVLADAKIGLHKLNNLLSDMGYKTKDSYNQEIALLKEEWMHEHRRLTTPSQSTSIKQSEALALVNNFMSPKDICVAASGSLPGDLMRLWQAGEPGSFHLEYGFSCMGYEVAGALGAKMAAPESEVYAIVGDGAFLMLNTELLTSLQTRHKIVVILFNNQGYRCINNLQASLKSPNFGNVFSLEVDFASYAQSMGALGFHVKKLSDLEPALMQARRAEKSVLIQIDVAPDSMSGSYDTFWRVDA